MFVFKYWVEFDEEGEIKTLYKSKRDCKGVCEEFIVKLIPIDREDDLDLTIKELNKEVMDFSEGIAGIKDLSKKVSSEVSKIGDLIKRIK